MILIAPQGMLSPILVQIHHLPRHDFFFRLNPVEVNPLFQIPGRPALVLGSGAELPLKNSFD